MPDTLTSAQPETPKLALPSMKPLLAKWVNKCGLTPLENELSLAAILSLNSMPDGTPKQRLLEAVEKTLAKEVSR